MAARRRKFSRLADALAADPADVRALCLGRSTSEPLETLPSAVFAMTGLQQLVVDDLGLTSLPPELGQLVALKQLSLRGNRLTSLPPEVGQLRRLNEVDLSGNPPMLLPPEFFALRADKVVYPDGLVPDVAALVAEIAGPPAPSPGGLTLAAEFSNRFGAWPSPDVDAYACATRGMARLPGPFELYGLGEARATRHTFARLWGFDEYGDTPIPAVMIGGDGRGAQFWLHLSDGEVLALRHDALFEFADETRQMLRRVGRDTPAELMREMVHAGSLIDLRTLLYLQSELPRLGITDWSAFMRRPARPLRAAVFRLICLGKRMAPGHLRGAARWRATASRFMKPILSA